MKIAIFAARYPVPYKPYYDSQFVDLIDRGHELVIYSTGALNEKLNEKVLRYGLQRRTRHFPATLRDVPRHLPAVMRGLGRAALGVGELRAVADAVDSGKRRAVHLARWFAIRNGKADLCLVHGLGTATLVPWAKRAVGDAPTALYYHGGEVPSVQPIPEALARDAFGRADIVFTNTEFSRQHAIERGCPEEKTAILPVGFDLRDFPATEGRPYRRDGRLHLLSAGRMSEEKGFVHALQALKLLADRGIRDITYALTGEGYLRPKLEAYVRENGLEQQVQFLGTLSTGGVHRAMAEADALLLPSIQVGNWVENQAAAVQEAMLMRALVVTTRTGGVPESIPEAMRPFSVPEADPGALADAIAAIHALREDQLRALGEECRRFVIENYDIRKLNDRLIELTLGAGRVAGGASR